MTDIYFNTGSRSLNPRVFEELLEPALTQSGIRTYTFCGAYSTDNEYIVKVSIEADGAEMLHLALLKPYSRKLKENAGNWQEWEPGVIRFLINF
jgi:hypothetical protein